MSRNNYIQNYQLRTFRNDSPIQKESIKSLKIQLEDTQHAKNEIEEKYQK